MRSLFRQLAIAVSIVAIGTLVGGMMPVSPATPDPAPVVGVSPRGDRPVERSVCRTAPWPYRPGVCLTAADGRPVADVRFVTVETRIGDDASALVALSGG
ncbi:hypothetical protein [Mongoliimonas terrestris]|uniref:hypothetical protein n=1 Tax=Mongoliimonas terrestris TaxID=1709001 RepID=UPI000949880C|nr:hypothetical protein [Mongoliimonas terrestris]